MHEKNRYKLLINKAHCGSSHWMLVLKLQKSLGNSFSWSTVRAYLRLTDSVQYNNIHCALVECSKKTFAGCCYDDDDDRWPTIHHCQVEGKNSACVIETRERRLSREAKKENSINVFLCHFGTLYFVGWSFVFPSSSSFNNDNNIHFFPPSQV